MKIYKILLFVFCLLTIAVIQAQNIQLIMSPNPSPFIADWQERTETVKLIITNTSGKDVDVKIKTELFDGKGSLVANTDAAKMPTLTVSPGTTTYDPEDVFPLSAVKYHGNMEKSTMATGRIPDDNYRICIALTDPKTGNVVGSSGTVCKTFNITAFQAPVLLNPKNDEQITETAIKSILFRWTPVTPLPKTPMQYRLQVWEVLPGQDKNNALRTNKPILEKDYPGGIMQTTWPSDFAMPEPGKSYVWTVTPLDMQERKLVDGYGFAEPFGFEVSITPPPLAKGNNPTIDLISPDDNTELNPANDITFKWTLTEPKPPGSITYRLKVWQLMQGQSSVTAMRTNKPIVTKDVDNLTEVTVAGIYTGPCRPPYLCDYVWSVDAMANGASFGSGDASFFSFKNGLTSIVLQAPLNEAKLDPASDLTFRWTPIVPKPKDPVTYRLKVWQLMQGQDGTQAMRTNKPIVTKDVADIAEATISGIYTGPCRPPYLCDYVWSVVPVINYTAVENQRSEPAIFHFNQDNLIAINSAAPRGVLEAGPFEEIAFSWSPLQPKPAEPFTYRLKVWQLMQGQNSTQAMRTNKPIVTKDVDNITATTIADIYTGPCRPPYLCDFVWTIEAVTKTGKIIGGSDGAEFSVKEKNNASVKLITPTQNAEIDPVSSLTFRWIQAIANPKIPFKYNFKLWHLKQGQTEQQAVRENQPVASKTIADKTEVEISDAFTCPCCPPYICDFAWVVQMVDNEGKPIGENEGKSEIGMFHFKEEKTATIVLQTPLNGATLNATDNIIFKWLPIAPKPAGSVIYRLKVWQLMQGQNGTTAMRSNQPIVTKDVDNITELTIAGIYTGPCKPPYLCDYVWSVTAIIKDQPTVDDAKINYSIFTIGENANRNLGDPIHGVDVKLGFEKIAQIEQINNIEISLEIKIKNAKGDPIHGVDIKLGATALNAQGDPVPGVVIKLGALAKSTNSQGDPVHGVVVKRGFNKTTNTQGDPIPGVVIKLGFEGNKNLTDSIYSVEIIATINASNAQGDPIHGVDVKLGATATNAQGDPVHGVVVKRGLKE